MPSQALIGHSFPIEFLSRVDGLVSQEEKVSIDDWAPILFVVNHSLRVHSSPALATCRAIGFSSGAAHSFDEEAEAPEMER